MPEKDGNKFDDDFVPLDNNTQESTRAQFADFNGMYPGKAMTFAFKIENKSSASLSITKLTSNDSNMQGLVGTDDQPQDRFVATTSEEELINVGWAINIYATTLVADTGYTSYVNDPSNEYQREDKFLYEGGITVSDESHRRATYLAGSTTNNVVTLTNPISLFDSSSLDDTKTTYLFFSVMFSDESSTFYKEVASDSGTAEEIDVIPPTGNRYFKKATTGNSNCYGNLTFALNELLLR